MPSVAVTMLVAMAAVAAVEPVTAHDGAGACTVAGPGTVVRLAQGDYAPGMHIAGRHGGPERPIVIEAADPERAPVFSGGNEAIHVTSCSHLVLRNLAMRGQKHNGLNIDDGSQAGSSHDVLDEHVRVEDVGPYGNDEAIKPSGLHDIVVRGCSVRGWGGQGVDMVGCHRGLIDRCSFTGKV